MNKMVQWTGYNKRQTVLLFKPDAILKKAAEYRSFGGTVRVKIVPWSYGETDDTAKVEICLANIMVSEYSDLKEIANDKCI